MKKFILLINLVGICLLFLMGCGELGQDNASSDIVPIYSARTVANLELITEIANEFYENHSDEYDMLVLWSAPEFGPGNSFYVPVKNDVPGIGYANVGTELFDDSADFGSERLQGIIWMGPDWITNTEDGLGPRSNLGILAQETGHRWAATINYKDAGVDSNALLEDTYHWNFYLNTGASPMGGNNWESIGDSLYKALPVDNVEFSQLDLYLMGLLSADQVDPLELLVNPLNRNELLNSSLAKVYSRTTQPIAIEANLVEISIEEIIASEGERDPDVGFNAENIRQAWIYVYQGVDLLSYNSTLAELEELRDQWSDYFSDATGGLSNMDTTLDSNN